MPVAFIVFLFPSRIIYIQVFCLEIGCKYQYKQTILLETLI